MPPFSFACQAYTNHTQRTSRRPITVTATEPRNQTPSTVTTVLSVLTPIPHFGAGAATASPPVITRLNPPVLSPLNLRPGQSVKIPDLSLSSFRLRQYASTAQSPSGATLRVQLWVCFLPCHAMPCRNQRARRPRKKKTGAVDVIVLTAQSINHYRGPGLGLHCFCVPTVVSWMASLALLGGILPDWLTESNKLPPPGARGKTKLAATATAAATAAATCSDTAVSRAARAGDRAKSARVEWSELCFVAPSGTCLMLDACPALPCPCILFYK
jgi:hypothetical protein